MIDPALFTLVLRLGRSVMLERERSREWREKERKCRAAWQEVGQGGVEVGATGASES